MKKPSTQSQYRQVSPSTGTSPDVLDELKLLKSLETRGTQSKAA